MTGGGQFCVYSWPDLDSFYHSVTSILVAVNFNPISSFNAVRLSQLVWCRDHLIVWKSKFHSQDDHELNASFALPTAIVADSTGLDSVRPSWDAWRRRWRRPDDDGGRGRTRGRRCSSAGRTMESRLKHESARIVQFVCNGVDEIFQNARIF